MYLYERLMIRYSNGTTKGHVKVLHAHGTFILKVFHKILLNFLLFALLLYEH